MKIGSLFSGFGGLDLAVEAVFPAARVAWVSDIEPGPCKVLARHFPDAPNLGDVTAIDWRAVEPVEILTGGSPCQDISAAGSRAGMREGTRSNLWVAMREAIAELRPALVVWENVSAATFARAASAMESDPRLLGGHPAGTPALRALGRVLGDLAALGYDAQWLSVRASDVGAPHRRERLFVAAADALREPRDPWQSTPRPAPGWGARREPKRRDREPITGALFPTPAASRPNDGETAASWLARRERVRAALRNGNGMGMPLSIAVQLLPTPTSRDEKGRNQRDDATCLAGAIGQRWGDYAEAIARWEQFAGRAPEPTKPGRNGQPKLSPRFVEWLMGLPAGWVTDTPGLSDSAALRLLGNGVVPQQAAAALLSIFARLGDLSDPLERTAG